MLFAIIFFITATTVASQSQKPNIVLILADDQDTYLGGMDFLPKIKKHLNDEGVNFTNFFVNTPICCPSRAELVSGRYGHNLLVTDTTAKACMHANITGSYFIENQLGNYMAALGYTTGLIGKYMNSPACQCPKEAGCNGGVTPDSDFLPG